MSLPWGSGYVIRNVSSLMTRFGILPRKPTIPQTSLCAAQALVRAKPDLASVSMTHRSADSAYDRLCFRRSLSGM